jgi:hypothetical protein
MSGSRGEGRRSVTSAGEARSADEGAGAGGDAEERALLADGGALSFQIAGLHVLLVDDDPLCSMIVSKMLRRRAPQRGAPTRARARGSRAPNERARTGLPAPRCRAHAVPPPTRAAAATT